MSGITLDKDLEGPKLEFLIDEGNSDTVFIRVYSVESETGITDTDDFTLDGGAYVATGPVSPYNEITTTSPNDFLLKVSGNDTLGAFLEDKLVAGTNITLAVNNEGANETITIDAAGGGAGEANTASNIGSGGVGVFDGKVGVDLQFKNINENGDGDITVVDDSGNNEIDLGLTDTGVVAGTYEKATVTVDAKGRVTSIFGKFEDFISTTSGIINNTNTLEEFFSLSVNLPRTADYKISWSYTWSLNDGSQDFVGQIELDNTTTIMEHNQEPKDTAGAGITLPLVGGGTANTGTNQRQLASGFEIINIAAGIHSIDLDWAGSANGDFAAIYRACISIEEF